MHFNSHNNSTQILEKSSFIYEMEDRRIKLTNAISIISLFSSIAFVAYMTIIGFHKLHTPIIIGCFVTPVFLFPIVLNKYNFHLAAKLLIASFASIMIVIFTFYYFGVESGIHVFLLVYGIIPIFIWSSKQIIYPITFFTLNLLSFIYIEFFNPPISQDINFPSEYISLTRGFSVLVGFLGASVAMVVFHSLVKKKEDLLHKQNNKIEQQKSLLIELNTNLNEKIEELITQQEELNQSDFVKSKIYSVIAHDLRSPFSSINGLLAHILEDYNRLESSQLEGYIKSIHTTSLNTFILLENLLEWSRMQTGKIKVLPEKTDLHSITQEAISINKVFFIKKNIRLSNLINEKLIGYIDKYMLSTILRNIISNAIKFTPKNGEITINATPTSNKKIILNITDTGIGMTKSEIDKLFNVEEDYTKLGTNKEKGTGLGLLICKEFIEKNGGELFIKSAPGKGSTFSFSLIQKN